MIQYSSRHFLIRSPAGLLAPHEPGELAALLGATFSGVADLLELKQLSEEPIRVDIYEAIPADPAGTATITADPAWSIRVMHQAGSPLPDLRRTVVELALTIAAGRDCGGAGALIDGLLNCVTERAGVALPAPDGQQASFVRFLIDRHGPEAFIRFAAALDPERPDLAADQVYRKPLAILEMEWRETLQSARRPQAGFRDFIRLSASHLQAQWLLVIGLLATVILGMSDEVLRPLLYRQILDKAVLGRDAQLLALLLAALVGLLLVESLTSLGGPYLSARLGAQIQRELRPRLFHRLQRVPFQTYQKTPAFQIAKDIADDIGYMRDGLESVLVGGISAALVGLISLIILFTVDWRLSLVGVTCAATVFIVPRLLEARAVTSEKQRKDSEDEAERTIIENLSAQTVVRAFGLEPVVDRIYTGQVATLARHELRSTFLKGLTETTTSMGAAAVQVAVFMAGAYLALLGTLTVGTLLMFVSQFRTVVESIKQLANVRLPMVLAAQGMARLHQILDAPEAVADSPGATPFPEQFTALHVDNVTFSYTGQEVNLRDVSLTIPAGAFVVVIGLSGSGKSTLLQLVLRLFDPNVGAITIDGRDLRHVQLESLRSRTAAVLQDSLLFNTTIGENIRTGRLDATDAEVEAAARAVGIHDFIVSLPQGYETLTGDGGSRLSGGQRQRVALARAILRDPAILVLDEATSALDPETEAAIIHNLGELRGNKTVIFATHRLTATSGADVIVVMDRGRVAEQGTHEDLLAANGLYARLWRHQTVDMAAQATEPLTLNAELLRSIPLFAHMDAPVLNLVANRLVEESFAPGDIIVAQGDPGDKFYILVSGAADVIHQIGDGKEIRLATLNDGSYFGEMALLEDVPRTATVRTRAPCRVLSLEQADFNRLLFLVPDLRGVLEQAISERTQQNAWTLRHETPTEHSKGVDSMLTELQKRKFTRYFNVLDYDRNGYIEEEDFAQILSNLAELRGWKPGTPEYAALRAGVMSIWENTSKFGDADGDGRCTLTEFLQMEEENLASEERYRIYATDVGKGIFDVVDADGDGVIGPDEFANFFRAFRLQDAEAREAFAKLDLNGDGHLSKDEIVEMVRQFHYSDDPASAGNWLFGRW